MATNRAEALQVVDPVLTEIARLYQSHGFIYDQLMVDLPVATETGEYVVFDDQYWFSNDTETLAQDRAPTREVDYEWSTETYRAEEHRLKVSLTPRERRQAAQSGVFDLESDKVRFLAHRMAIAREVRLARLLMPSGDGGGLGASRTDTPGNNWDQDSATIEADIKKGVLDVYDTIGIVPNTIVIPYKVAYAMALQKDVRDILASQISGGSPDFLRVGDRVIPAVIHGMRVVIPQGAQVDAANEGGTPSKSEIWGDHVRLLYVDHNAGRFQPTVARRFLVEGPMVKTWETNDPDVKYFRQSELHDEKVVAPDAGYVIKSVLS